MPHRRVGGVFRILRRDLLHGSNDGVDRDESEELAPLAVDERFGRSRNQHGVEGVVERRAGAHQREVVGVLGLHPVRAQKLLGRDPSHRTFFEVENRHVAHAGVPDPLGDLARVFARAGANGFLELNSADSREAELAQARA